LVGTGITTVDGTFGIDVNGTMTIDEWCGTGKTSVGGTVVGK